MAAHRPELEESGLIWERFQRFQDCNKAAFQDATIKATVLPIIAGKSNTTTANDLIFGNLENLTDGSLTKPVSSCCDGFLPVQIDLQIREDLGRYIVPSKKPIILCLPNFFLEGVEQNWDVAKRWGCHCGTLGAHGVYKLHSLLTQSQRWTTRHTQLWQLFTKKAVTSCLQFILLWWSGG